MLLLIGGYTLRMDENTPGEARGISAYDFYAKDNGRMEFRGFTPVVNPSYLIADREKSIVYSLSECPAPDGASLQAHRVKRDGSKVAFQLLGEVSLPGDHPCHLAFVEDTIVVASFTSGHLHVVKRLADGRLGERIQDIKLTHSTEKGSRAHCTAYDAPRGRVYVCDLGDDRFKTFRRLPDGRLEHLPELDLVCASGEGPRHVALHPNGDFALVNGEFRGYVRLVDLRGDKPSIADTVAALPERVVDEASGAAIRVTKNGKNCFVSDRTFDLVTTIRIDEKAAKLSVRDSYSSGGDSPREVILSPSEEWLLTANNVDSKVGVFRVGTAGDLTHYRTYNKIPTPTTFAWL